MAKETKQMSNFSLLHNDATAQDLHQNLTFENDLFLFHLTGVF